ncbi:MAG TPA: hypothetical protein VE783_10245 [Candidatus Limnocylindrales bacterium]|nr:hypothetical protein [Candidatus Limnocylindrales bacterium]
MRRNTSGKLAITCALLLALSGYAQRPSTPPSPAQVPASQGGVAPFDMIGIMQFASVDTQCQRNSNPTPQNPPQPAGCKASGGWIQINGHVIRVPQNTILQMPANTLTWEEVFEYNPAGSGDETGMALTDGSRLPGTFEAHVQGNVVNGTYIAGLIFLSQQSLNSSQGFIESLDYANGIMVVNGTKIQINDPAGKFSIGKSPDVRFSIDEDNPTVRAETAFPMCIPRQDPAMGDDPLCPQKNRPRDSSGNFVMNYTMDPRGAFPSPASPNPTDPTVFAPFEVGDYVTYAGTLLDYNGTRILSAHTVIANVGIYTTPGDVPAYVAIDVLLQGAPGIPNPAFPQEATAKARVEGFSTDPSRPVDIFAVDQDCNGVVTDRAPWAFEFTVEPGPPTLGKKGRFRFRPTGGSFLPPSRVVGVQIDYPPPAVFNQKLGIMAGRYQAPNFTFIFPENLAVGDPPVPLNFNDLPFLVNGSGPWGFGNQPIGQLNPWPGGSAPQMTCTAVPGGTPPPPTATAVASYTASATPIVAGTTVTLSANGSTPSNGPFAWSQLANSGDPTIALSTTNAMTATFTAPTVATPTNLTFQVSVGGGNSTTPATATVSVPIVPPAAPAPPAVSASAAPASPVASGTSVTLNASGVDPAGGTLSYTWLAPQGVTLSASSGDGSQQKFLAPTVPAGSAPSTFSFTVTAKSSASGLSSTATVNVTVNPILDVITITSAVYRTLKGSMTVNVTDITPGIKLTCTLDITNPATGKPWTGVMGPAVPAAVGNYSIVFTGVNQPTRVTVTSTAGGTASSGVTRVRQ